MFPLSFPLEILSRRGRAGQVVLDPFCGRGTTNFAARVAGLTSVGVDTSKVATAISQAKLVSVSHEAIVDEARIILAASAQQAVPSGDFWHLAYHPMVLQALCKWRAALGSECSTPERIALRGLILGALHGPRQKGMASYFSNQSPRTYAPKPAYATRFWMDRKMEPPELDPVELIERRALRFYAESFDATGVVRNADSRSRESLAPPEGSEGFDWIITSPPYYGMRTYIPDQWLRNWFVGGSDEVVYGNQNQVAHTSPEVFASDLRAVWKNAAAFSSTDARLVVRFGGISDRRADPLSLAKASLQDSGWKIVTIRDAGTATAGKRQADAFLRTRSKPLTEYDIWATKR